MQERVWNEHFMVILITDPYHHENQSENILYIKILSDSFLCYFHSLRSITLLEAVVCFNISLFKVVKLAIDMDKPEFHGQFGHRIQWSYLGIRTWNNWNWNKWSFYSHSIYELVVVLFQGGLRTPLEFGTGIWTQPCKFW